MTLETLPLLATLALMHLLGAVTPGPNFVTVSHYSAAHSRRHGLIAAAGVVAATMAWVVSCLAGVGVLLLEAGWLYHLLRIAGAAYLAFVGLRMVLSALRGRGTGGDGDGMRPPVRLRPFRAGMLTTFANPKTAVFWTSLFIVAVPPHASLVFYAAVVAVVFVQSSLWYGSVALVLSSGAASRAYRVARRWIDAALGTVMAGLGVGLAVDALADAE